MNRDRFKPSTIAAVLLVGTLVYVLLIWWSGPADVTRSLTLLSAPTLLFVMVLVSLAYLLRFVRWHYYLRVLDFQVPWRPNLRIFLASFLMSLSPGKFGEAIKSYFLKEEYAVPVAPTVAAFFCERFTDVLAMIVLCSAGFLVYPHGDWIIGSMLLLQLLALYILQRREWMERLVFRPLSSLDWLEHWIDRLRRFYRSAGRLLTLRRLGVGTGLGLVSWGFEGLCLYLILRDLGVTELSVPVAVFVFSASVLLGAASMVPGGLGSSEVLMVAMLSFFGVTRPVAVSATLLVRVVTLWYGVALGFLTWLLSVRQIRLKELETQELDAEIS